MTGSILETPYALPHFAIASKLLTSLVCVYPETPAGSGAGERTRKCPPGCVSRAELSRLLVTPPLDTNLASPLSSFLYFPFSSFILSSSLLSFVEYPPFLTLTAYKLFLLEWLFSSSHNISGFLFFLKHTHFSTSFTAVYIATNCNKSTVIVIALFVWNIWYLAHNVLCFCYCASVKTACFHAAC